MRGEVPVIPGDEALDSEYAWRARLRVDEAVRSASRRIVFDLGSCSLVDRQGMAVVRYGVPSVTQAGGRAAVVVADAHVRDVLVMLGLSEMPGVLLCGTVEEAAAGLEGGSGLGYGIQRMIWHAPHPGRLPQRRRRA